MCYDISAKLESQLRIAYIKNDMALYEKIKRALEELDVQDLHHASGFSHPHLVIYRNESPAEPFLAQWGLIPSWTKSEEDAKKFWNNTLNARIETIFEKASFRESARAHRCIIQVDGFFEHKHVRGNTYPHFITNKIEEPLSLAGLWSKWTNPATGEAVATFTIVTTRANELMGKIHNNPKLKEGRMPVIINGFEDDWLNLDKQEELIEFASDVAQGTELKAHTVQKLRGKDAIGNTEEATEEYIYDELNTLF
ncbi:MAG: SOS response-associated peptidase [Crocinitomicaceae bacterium]|nr:SOS response-associated peptidase [Crocinitomicaceae bacterium]